MKTKTGFLICPFLILIFASALVSVAFAQQTCRLPAGATPPADPRVTAQQVESGSASLMDFALAARDRYMSLGQEFTTLEGASYVQCRIREEGSPWRSGSTYIVFLTPDGRVFEHAKSMALSGRLLKPPIYGAILQTLGINPADLTGPVAAGAAFAAAAGNSGSFNIPNVPGASGYAAVYAANPQVPIMLAGFEIDESHLAEEEIDFGNPAITAAEVVDRSTLKAFVAESIKYFLSVLEKNDPAAISKARIALRDPNGPWKHGSVYLYALERTSNIIWFHGAFPDRFEYRPLVATVRDEVTGHLVLPQVIEAATSSPEGGFVEYYFDDPTDDTDSADIPKVGYARQINVPIRRSDGTLFNLDFIVGSGFYQSDPGVVAARQNKAIKDVLPQVMRAMTASTVDAISSRIEQTTSGASSARSFSLGGASSLSGALLSAGQSLGSDTFDLTRLLLGSSFTLPLNGEGSSGRFGGWSLWGSGSYRDFDGGDRELDYNGDVVSAHLGLDSRLHDDLLAGISLSWAEGTVDYTDAGNLQGKSRTTLTSLHPYVGWQASGSMSLWATAGYGWGEVEVNDQSAEKEDSDMDQQMVAAGINGLLYEADTMTLRLKAETAFTWADIDGSGTLESMSLNANRQRLLLEGVHVQKLASGAILSPSLELGVRHDGGDGDTGSSIEAGGSLRYNDPESGLTVEARARTLLDHSDDYDEWGVSGLVQLDPGTAGVGLALSIQPAWGQAYGDVQRLWETGVSGDGILFDQSSGRVDARLAYGMGTAWGGMLGVLTPYTDVSLYGEGARRVSLGSEFDLGTMLRMRLESQHLEPAYGESDHSVMLHSEMNW